MSPLPLKIPSLCHTGKSVGSISLVTASLGPPAEECMRITCAQTLNVRENIAFQDIQGLARFWKQ